MCWMVLQGDKVQNKCTNIYHCDLYVGFVPVTRTEPALEDTLVVPSTDKIKYAT